MNGRAMFTQTTNDKQTPKHKLGNLTNRWPKVRADARCPNSKKKLKVYMTELFFICSIKSPQCADKCSTKNFSIAIFLPRFLGHFLIVS